jgi:hypothetical protein
LKGGEVMVSGLNLRVVDFIFIDEEFVYVLEDGRIYSLSPRDVVRMVDFCRRYWYRPDECLARDSDRFLSKLFKEN